MKKEFEYLKKEFGSHVAVAKEIGISPEHYRRFRNQDIGSKLLRNFIRMKVNEIKMKRLTQ